MSNSVLIDLVVLSHNGINTTKKFLDHLSKNKPDEKIRIIWIDNGSIDETFDYVAEYLKNNLFFDCILVKSPINLGVINGRNLGYELSKKYNKKLSEYVMFLDNDQYVFSGWMSHHLSVMNHGYDLIGVEAWRINNSMMPETKIGDISQQFSYIGCGGMLIRRDVVEKIGLFDKIYNPAYFEDPDLSIRCYKAGFKIGWNVKAKIIHIPHQTLKSQSNARKSFMESFKKFRTKWKFSDVPILIQRDLEEFH